MKNENEKTKTVIQELLFSAIDSLQVKPLFKDCLSMAKFLNDEKDSPYFGRGEVSVHNSLRQFMGTNHPFTSTFKIVVKFIVLPKFCKSDKIKELILKELENKTLSSKKVQWDFPETLNVEELWLLLEKAENADSKKIYLIDVKKIIQNK